MAENRPSLIGLTRDDFARLCQQCGAKPVHALGLTAHVFRHGTTNIDAMAGLPENLREHVKRQTCLPDVRVTQRLRSADGTTKLLLEMADGGRVESVLIPGKDRLTLCLSTQQGCAMGCDFCLTARAGLTRHLEAGEMVAQVQMAKREAGDGKVSNLVLMGMGEPLHNYEEVVRFVRIATDPAGMAYSPRRVTVSTVGLAPAIHRLAKDGVPCNLAVSLNATTDAVRDKIMPVNRRYPIVALLDAVRDFTEVAGKRVLIEYVLLAGVNDSDADAQRLCGLLADTPCTINLLPFNAFDGSAYQCPSDARVSAFRATLVKAGFIAVVRESRGRDILAACGQLFTQTEARAA
ncbi:MAG: 23S rRNA (adenine(2503)-C(2))-methyltransferase RlmN [Mariprofundaceae bacterium]